MAEETKELDEFHKHELLDRISVINQMFTDFVVNHPAAHLIKEEITDVDTALAEAYQAAGRVRFHE